VIRWAVVDLLNRRAEMKLSPDTNSYLEKAALGSLLRREQPESRWVIETTGPATAYHKAEFSGWSMGRIG
jgi:hypothetical protein